MMAKAAGATVSGLTSMFMFMGFSHLGCQSLMECHDSYHVV